MKSYKKICLAWLLFTIVITIMMFVNSGCKEDNDEEIETNYRINQYIYKKMKTEQWYFWYDQVPDINPMDYYYPDEYLDALIYSDIDKWSYITDAKTFDAHYTSGTLTGYGFSYKWDYSDKVRVSFVYDGSPMDLAGVSRGFEILEIDDLKVQVIEKHDAWEVILGKDSIGATNTFKMVSLTGDTSTMKIAKTEVTVSSVLYHGILETSGEKTGYMVLKTFIQPTTEELNTVFGEFKNAGISNLILDLRYNTGGLTEVSRELAGYIIGNRAEGQVYGVFTHNEKHSESNSAMYIESYDNTIDVTKVVIITSNLTASASEAVINCLEPYIDVVTIGEKTYGKPVGMYVYHYLEHVLVPICFEIVNANGEGDYYDGIAVDAFCYDGLDRPFGDSMELCLKEAVYYLENNSFSDTATTKKLLSTHEEIYQKGLRFFIGAY